MRILLAGALFLSGSGAAPLLGAEPETDAVEVTVPPGLGAAATAELLAEKGVIGSVWFFRAAAKLTGDDRRIKPGTYRLRRGLSARAALRELCQGTANDLKVSIPEGFSSRQIADRLQANGFGPAEAFLAIVAENLWEGFLFPTTYNFDRGWDARKVAERMRAEFKRRVEPEYEAAVPKPSLTLKQTVILASIVEREAVLSEEKPMIAAVYLNRLKIRKMLEADPTVQYALGYWKKGLTLADLKHPSPYNTYNHYGLPPGPICNPGVDAVRAVLRPATTDAIYFVADAKGGHVFTSTLEEHLKAKSRFKRDQRIINERIRAQERAQSR